MESNKPLVSLIITTKNEEAHIERCLQSIKSQSYKRLEMIVVDNNSTDSTKEISEKYTKLIFNKGPERSAQRNLGAKKSKGEFLVFIDADMILTKNVIKDCVEKIKLGNFGGIVIPEKSIGEGFWSKVKTFERSLYEGEESIEAARFFNRDVFFKSGGYDERITGPEDWDLPQKVKKNYKIGRVKSYILHDEGRTSLFNLIKKKHYYGLKVSSYLGNHPVEVTSSQVIYLLRPVFYRKWKKLLRNPVLTLGMIIMLFFEQLAGFIGFVEGLTKK